MRAKALWIAIKARLDALAIFEDVYDGAPDGAEMPYAEWGSVVGRPDKADCIDSREFTLQIDIWERKFSHLSECADLVDQVVDGLDEAVLVLADPYAAVFCNVVLHRTMEDPDGVTAHGVVQVTASVENVP